MIQLTNKHVWSNYASFVGNKSKRFYFTLLGVIKSNCKFKMTILLIILIDNSLNSRITLTLFQVVVFIFFATKIFYFATKFLELVATLRLNFVF